MSWLENANFAETVCDAFVNWEEKFYICPECGEPIYETDWEEAELDKEFCPICGVIYESLE